MISLECVIQCTSTESYKKFVPLAQMSGSSHSPVISPESKSESRMKRNISTETEDDDSGTSIVGLYKQVKSVKINILYFHS